WPAAAGAPWMNGSDRIFLPRKQRREWTFYSFYAKISIMTNQLYVARFKEAFLNSPPETFGTAYQTAGEYLGRQQLAERLGPHANRQTLDDFESEHPQPLPSHITPEMVGLAAASHACGVAIKLAEERGPQGAAMTMRSYGAKNNFDRFTRR